MRGIVQRVHLFLPVCVFLLDLGFISLGLVKPSEVYLGVLVFFYGFCTLSRFYIFIVSIRN